MGFWEEELPWFWEDDHDLVIYSKIPGEPLNGFKKCEGPRKASRVIVSVITILYNCGDNLNYDRDSR